MSMTFLKCHDHLGQKSNRNKTREHSKWAFTPR
jgi:hypothetical protein